jgi:hypothetical protein
VRAVLKQVTACRTAAVLDHPDQYGAIVRTVRTLVAQPAGAPRLEMVNVDGLRLMTRGAVMFSVSGRVRLVDAGVTILQAG